MDTHTATNLVSEVPYPDGIVELGANSTKLGWGSTVSATVKLLQGIKDSANGFIPLKSVARGLSIILENCEVWPPSCIFSLWCL